ncbi:MAG: fused MFS/spermidine synthase [Kiritimatiellia bacterium]|jgi:spermidine synthase|nr:fused MFS/spermidine synthase [Kiritimatiellia bacterium]MDP6848022.1 fused MFS/spermidine synthase [Kiritimatiellia bacterium]
MVYVLVFFSGLAGLIYEILWMKQLGLLFGNTSHAASATLAAFFAGLAAGSWFWGRRSSRAANSLRVYAWLEAGIAVTALLYFVIIGVYYRIYPSVYQGIGSASLLLLIKFALALLLIFPPAFCMGGTIPVIAQYAVRRQSAFGTTSALLYGINTLGAATGACLAGFFLPLWLGFRVTCAGAMMITAAVAVVAFVLSRNVVPAEGDRGAADGEAAVPPGPSEGASALLTSGGRWAVMLVCFLSGFGVLALEVLWTRMFAQVLENSVYTFAAILVIVLLCLAAGAFISSRLARLAVSPFYLLGLLTVISGIAVSATPFIFMRLTNSFQILASKGSWFGYVMLIFKNGFLTIGPPALLLGTVFPFLMKTEERYAVSAGRTLGRLAAVNTVGAILGSLACGFVFLGTLGMWRTMQLISVVYLVAALVLPLAWDLKSVVLKAVTTIFLILQFAALDPTQLPITSVDTMRQREEILETWEASDCTVAVARDMYGLSIKINSHYGLGSTGAFMQEKLQADIPLMIYPRTESIFFLGLGTGITAGSALDSQFESVKRVVACELVPEVITAARKYMTNVDGFDCTGGLFSDPRVTILAEDGRHYLMATEDRFDMVNGDLFVPYRSGAGSLYSKEHFQSVKERLEPGGVFFQWLPLYQVTENEFSIIARTMLEVFDQVSLWRNNFQPGEEVVVLAGHGDDTPLPACAIDGSADKLTAIAGKNHRDLQQLSLPFNSQTILFFYCGNVTEARELFADYPVNSDDRPLIEYMAPRTYRNKTDAAVPWFVGPRIARLVEEIQRLCPPERDPLLVDRTDGNRRLPVAGAAFHRARLWEVIGDEEECRQSWQRFLTEWTDEGQVTR